LAKQFVVLGAGRFGSSVSTTLCNLGHDVLVVDKDEELIQQVSLKVTNAVQADSTSEKALKSLGIKDFDAVVLAIGTDVHASIMTAILLVELGANYIVAKAQTELHGRVLEKIGVNRIVFPERDMGQRIAHSLISPSIIDLIEVSDDYSLVEVTAPKEMIGKTLQDLNIRARYGISIIALRHHNVDQANISPQAEDIIEENDIIVAIGENKALKKMEWM